MTVTEEAHERAHDEDIPAPTLLSKLREVAAAVGEIPKDARNEFHKYDYASIEGVVRATRLELLKRGVLIVPGIDHIEERERQTNQGLSTVSTAHLIFTVYDTDSGEAIVVPWAGRGDDPADKGLSKAISDARKTFILSLLNLARGEDTEADHATDTRSYGQTPNTTNLVEHARGLSNEQLNQALKAVGLEAQASPFGAFTRIPSEHAARLREALGQIRG